METVRVESPNLNKSTSNSPEFSKSPDIDSVEEDSPIEQVRLTVSNHDDPSLPVWTFRMWFLGLISCCLLSFLNQFFSYRTEPLGIGHVIVQITALPIGHFMAAVLPEKQFRIPGFGKRLFSFNPGPFNMKEHVLITIFAGGSAYGVRIVAIIIAFYHRKISLFTSWLLVITTQLLGYGWAGLLKRYVVEPSHMWWPGIVANVSLFRALHEKENRRLTRAKFFLIALICSFCWYIVPGYLFTTASSIAWVCWVFPKSVTAQQIGSGLKGFGIGAFTLDWATIASYLGSPLYTPFFSIVNVIIGYVLVIYIFTPIAYWGFDLYGAQRFPIFSTKLFTSQGQIYDALAIVNNQFELDVEKYQEQGRLQLSMFFALSYGLGFASTASALTHVGFFYGREIYETFRATSKVKEDIHTRLMRKYKAIPPWWFHILNAVTIVITLVLCIAFNKQVQMPWWGLLLSICIGFIFTLPFSMLIATTNQAPGLNGSTDYIMGLIYPGYPIANVCFKVYSVSVWHAIRFIGDFKLGHYMKIPPRSMFLVQLLSTVISSTVDVGVAWWLLHSVENICQDNLLPPGSPWTCPYDRLFFDTSVIWGLIGPMRIFGPQGDYSSLNWFYLFGALGPIIVWLIHKAFPKYSWIPLVNFPVLLAAAGAIPPAMPLNYNAWIIVGITFNYFIFRYKTKWWQRYNYILSSALDAGVAFMTVLLYFTIKVENRVSWWGTKGEHCLLASCPIAKGIVSDGCPLN